MKDLYSSRVIAIALLLSMLAPAGADGREDIRAERKTNEVDRGRYLVRIAGCNDCHTAEYAAKEGAVAEAKWLTGSRVGFEGPWGTTYPSNLRLLIAELTREQWLSHARRRTRPPMPWFSLRDMNDGDLTAIYRYIRALGPAGARSPAYEPPEKPAKGGPVRRWRIE